MSTNYSNHFNDDDFWKKVTTAAQDAGRELIEQGRADILKRLD